MKIGDKAAAADQREIRLARDSMGLYRLESAEITPADEISDEDQFPKYGDFLDTVTSTGGANPAWDEPCWLEVPAGLDEELVKIEAEVGTVFRIQSVRKDGQTWDYSVVEASEEAENIEEPAD